MIFLETPHAREREWIFNLTRKWKTVSDAREREEWFKNEVVKLRIESGWNVVDFQFFNMDTNTSNIFLNCNGTCLAVEYSNFPIFKLCTFVCGRRGNNFFYNYYITRCLKLFTRSSPHGMDAHMRHIWGMVKINVNE